MCGLGREVMDGSKAEKRRGRSGEVMAFYMWFFGGRDTYCDRRGPIVLSFTLLLLLRPFYFGTKWTMESPVSICVHICILSVWGKMRDRRTGRGGACGR